MSRSDVPSLVLFVLLLAAIAATAKLAQSAGLF